MKSLDPLIFFLLYLFNDIPKGSRIIDKSMLTFNSIRLGYFLLCLNVKMKGWRMEGIALDHNPSFHFDYGIIVKPNRYNCVTRITVFVMLSALSVQNYARV